MTATELRLESSPVQQALPSLELARVQSLREVAGQILEEAGFRLATEDRILFPYRRPEVGALGPGGALMVMACRLGHEVAARGPAALAAEVRSWLEANYPAQRLDRQRRPEVGASLNEDQSRRLLDVWVAEDLERPWAQRQAPEDLVRRLERQYAVTQDLTELVEYVRRHRYRRVSRIHKAAVVLGRTGELGPELPADLHWVWLEELEASALRAGLWPATRRESRYLGYLPGIYQGDTFLQRFLHVFDPVTDSIERVIDNVVYYLDPLTTPEGFLPWLASWLGIELDESWPLPRRRQLVRWAAQILRGKGTRQGLRLHLQAYTGARPLIVDGFDGLRLGSEAALGWNSALGQAIPNGFSVTLCLDDPAEPREAVLRSIIDSDKPAHATYALHVRRRPA